MGTISMEMNVADIVTAVPWSADVFRKHRIDYCCGGKVSLLEAALEKGIQPDVVFEEITTVKKTQDNRGNTHPSSFGNKTLIAYIQENYHQNLRQELPSLAPYITRVSRVHGENHPHLRRLQDLFKELRIELLDHTEDEDRIVFPLMIEFLDKPTDRLKEKLKPHVFELEEEHENAGKLLRELREITNDFTPPEGACGTYRLVYARLEKLEKETFDHVHLENNILFERVRAEL
ncbi:iron-sulfur cluster repair di-iron protein [Sporosarcina sp. 6E9]|uniref:iron-sulfur cluster repair di-iron protein n=1 Tax=Sporosarcina sp. 6E9 TaxID=2819235 RepID=UPI001B310DCA|nr:iron-sulfur cluster repair di-iron protein [Sporosarcina sp. 6E9]